MLGAVARSFFAERHGLCRRAATVLCPALSSPRSLHIRDGTRPPSLLDALADHLQVGFGDSVASVEDSVLHGRLHHVAKDRLQRLQPPAVPRSAQPQRVDSPACAAAGCGARKRPRNCCTHLLEHRHRLRRERDVALCGGCGGRFVDHLLNVGPDEERARHGTFGERALGCRRALGCPGLSSERRERREGAESRAKRGARTGDRCSESAAAELFGHASSCGCRRTRASTWPSATSTGGWVWCSDSFRAQSESKMRTMPIEEGQLSQVIAVRTVDSTNRRARAIALLSRLRRAGGGGQVPLRPQRYDR